MKRFLNMLRPFALLGSMSSMIGLPLVQKPTITGSDMKKAVGAIIEKLLKAMLLLMYSSLIVIILTVAMPLFLLFLLGSLLILSSAMLLEVANRPLSYLIDQIDGM